MIYAFFIVPTQHYQLNTVSVATKVIDISSGVVQVVVAEDPPTWWRIHRPSLQLFCRVC